MFRKRSLWGEIMALQPSGTLRDFMRAHAQSIHFVTVESDSIFRDLDTAADYRRQHSLSQGKPPGDISDKAL